MGQIILKTGPQLIVKLDKVTVEMNELIDVAAITVLIVITAIVVIRANIAITYFTGITAITVIVSLKRKCYIEEEKSKSSLKDSIVLKGTITIWLGEGLKQKISGIFH